MKKLLDFDPVTKTRTNFHGSADGESFVIEDRMDVEDLVEQNKALHAATDARAGYGDLERVASIPLNIYLKLQKEGVLDDEKAFKRWLNDPANLAFRTRPGRV